MIIRINCYYAMYCYLGPPAPRAVGATAAGGAAEPDAKDPLSAVIYREL